MNVFSMELRQMVDQFILGDEEVSKWINKTKTIDSITRIPGDASTRKYYRVKSNQQSFIVMRMDSFAELGSDLPFLKVQKHLSACGVDVPAVLDVDAERGFILLEDLGDVTLLKSLQDVNAPDTERHLFEKVIDSLVQFQVKASLPSPQSGTNFEPFKLRFDCEKLMWEVKFAIENFYQIYLKREIADKDMAILLSGFNEIVAFLAEQPTVLTHRDFHSRNIMVISDRLVMIDFQDARMGPIQYDLSSLLKDSYYQLEDSQVSLLIDYYIAKYEALAGKQIDKGHFLKIFDLMSVQRNFKAIGSFASFMNRRGDSSYLKFIGNTFENIRRTLLRHPEFFKLRETLFQYYYF